MVTILPLEDRIIKEAKRHRIEKALAKQYVLLSQNAKHPSLHVELLEPKWRGVYSFRIDRKYRGIFVYDGSRKVIKILAITVHYR